MLYGHGDDRTLYQEEIKTDFSSNVFWESLEIPDEIWVNIQSKIGRYPDVCGDELAKKLAKKHGVEFENVLVENGSTPIFYMVAQHFQNRKGLIFTPCFSEYESAGKRHNLKLTFKHFEAFETIDFHQFDVVFLARPNNPDGFVLSEKTFIKTLQNHSKTTFVIDEAYVDFAQNHQSMVDFLGELNNLVIIRSPSKIFAIPGIRLGYLIGKGGFVNALKQFKMPWSNNVMAIEIGHYLAMVSKPCIDGLMMEKQRFVKLLKSIDIGEVLPSQTHYFLVKLHQKTAKELKLFLIKHHQILLRDASNFRGLNDGYIRLATQKKQDNDNLINALLDWKKQF